VKHWVGQFTILSTWLRQGDCISRTRSGLLDEFKRSMLARTRCDLFPPSHHLAAMDICYRRETTSYHRLLDSTSRHLI
jgi:hypothetical protein